MLEKIRNVNNLSLTANDGGGAIYSMAKAVLNLLIHKRPNKIATNDRKVIKRLS
jgi:hypothetical protein